MKIHLLTLVFCLFFKGLGHARTVIVSDIDDTLKISHILDKVSAVENSVHLENQFYGMSDLFNSLQSSDGLQFYYVSNALTFIHFLHSEFLSQHQFPKGPLVLRANYFDKEHKIRSITRIILKTRPSRVLLIGDNGERDSEIYAQIEKKFPRIQIISFIHQVYSLRSLIEVPNPILPGQIPYVTSVDLAFYLKRLNLLTKKSYYDLVQSMVPEIIHQRNDLYYGELAFPAWMDCQDFVRTNLDLSSDLLEAYAEKIRNRCSPNY